MQKAALPVAGAQLVHQFGGQAALGRAQGVGVPFGRVAVGHGHKSGLAAHGQAHIARLQAGIDGLASGQHLGPLRLGVRTGDAWRLVDALHRHAVIKMHVGLVHQALNGRGRSRLRRARQRNMALACEQARRRVQPHPAGAGQIDLAPGMQIGEIDLGAAGPVQGLDVGHQLDQVARHKAGGQPPVAQQLHHQPGRIAAGAAAQLQGLARGLHTGLHADQVGNVLVQALVERDQKIDGVGRPRVERGQVGGKFGAGRQAHQIGLQLAAQCRLVAQRHLLGRGLQKEINGVEHRHFGDQIDADLEFAGFFGEHQARLVVGKGVLLPVDEVSLGLNAQAVGQDLAAAVRRRAQADHLRAELDRTVVAVVGDVVQSDVDRHGDKPALARMKSVKEKASKNTSPLWPLQPRAAGIHALARRGPRARVKTPCFGARSARAGPPPGR